jgi:hypothetical protein
MLAGLDEPVRRYFTHAINDGAALPKGVHMAMSGRKPHTAHTGAQR